MQQDEEAPIRANTTILLGNLAQYLSEAKTKQILLNAFFRPLKDPFPPARIAGLKVNPSFSWQLHLRAFPVSSSSCMHNDELQMYYGK